MLCRTGQQRQPPFVGGCSRCGVSPASNVRSLVGNTLTCVGFPKEGIDVHLSFQALETLRMARSTDYPTVKDWVATSWIAQELIEQGAWVVES